MAADPSTPSSPSPHPGQPRPELRIVGDSGEHHQPRPLAQPDDWTLEVSGHVAHPRTFTLKELFALVPQSVHLRRLVNCVSAARISSHPDGARFGGVPFAALAEAVGVREASHLELGPTVELVSRAPATLGPRRLPHITHLPWVDAINPENGLLLATTFEGEPLPYRHGGPLRMVVGPGLYFYKSLKWLAHIRFLDRPLDQCRGTWEEYAGYHNRARVARKERFEPRMLRIVEIAEGPDGQPEDVLEVVPPERWNETFRQAYEARDLSRLVAARLHEMVDKMPRDFAGVTFSDGPYRAKIRGTKFSNADLRGADLTGGNFSLSYFAKTRFSDGDSDGDGGELPPARLDGADFEGSVFNDAELRQVSMRGACLTNASFVAQGGTKRQQPTDRVRGLDLRGAIHLDPSTARWLADHHARVDEDALEA